MSRFRDFDAAVAEAAGVPVTFRVRGQDFELPAELPAIVPLSVMALKAELGEGAEIPAESVLKLIRGVFGDETDRLLAAGVGLTQLNEILSWTLEQYSAPQTAAPQTAAAAQKPAQKPDQSPGE